METILMAALVALAQKVVAFVKYVRNGDWNGAVTQAATWLAGTLVVVLAAHADVLQGLDFGVGVPIGKVNGASQVFVGLTLGSLASVAYDFKKPRNPEPNLLGPPTPNP